MELGPVKGARHGRRAAVDGSMAGGADIELGELIVFDVDFVGWRTLTLLFYFLSLVDISTLVLEQGSMVDLDLLGREAWMIRRWQ